MSKFSDVLYSDLHKDAFGFRPTQEDYVQWNAKSDEEKQTHWNFMIVELECGIEEEEAAQKVNIKVFEVKLAAMVLEGIAADRNAAIQYLLDEYHHEHRGDEDYFCYLNNLPYGYINKTGDRK